MSTVVVHTIRRVLHADIRKSAYRTGEGALEDLLLRGRAVGEDVESERLGPLVDEVDGLLDRVDWHDRQNGTKDLLLHDLGVGVDVGEDRGRNVVVLDVDLATQEHVVA
jgi:hypothetical protein